MEEDLALLSQVGFGRLLINSALEGFVDDARMYVEIYDCPMDHWYLAC